MICRSADLKSTLVLVNGLTEGFLQKRDIQTRLTEWTMEKKALSFATQTCFLIIPDMAILNAEVKVFLWPIICPQVFGFTGDCLSSGEDYFHP
jgi:hypothetical protein